MAQILFGWYSEQQAKNIDSLVVYRGENGKEVTLTQISANRNHGSCWPDMQFKGMVTDYVKTIPNIGKRAKYIEEER